MPGHSLHLSRLLAEARFADSEPSLSLLSLWGSRTSAHPTAQPAQRQWPLSLTATALSRVAQKRCAPQQAAFESRSGNCKAALKNVLLVPAMATPEASRNHFWLEMKLHLRPLDSLHPLWDRPSGSVQQLLEGAGHAQPLSFHGAVFVRTQRGAPC
ncbi:hypothetical protein TREES_T100010402 [Tupaia chinensis]|uniref:Uncharacterized protein n=1 Tax=Tupaia chinensis TaxID=246437 RepID=L9LFP3_TUPCH|nr:hypothetical protein TREES_T100010402 [Tupaia chinensis]